MEITPSDLIGKASRRSKKIWKKEWERFTQGPSITKNITILFFVYFDTNNNKIHTIYRQTSVFVVIFSMMMFCFY
jgi:hypothetical protein